MYGLYETGGNQERNWLKHTCGGGPMGADCLHTVQLAVRGEQIIRSAQPCHQALEYGLRNIRTALEDAISGYIIA
jgi:hypothetical protein